MSPDGALCVGKWWLFDSTDRRDHHAARALCAQCPAFTWCAQRTADLARDHTYCRPLTGTWAGRLFGRPGNMRKLAPAEEPTFTDDELRALHAAYGRGERDETTRLGERIYSRQKAARRRKGAAA